MSSTHEPDNIAFHANLNSFTSSPITFPSSDENGVRFEDSYMELNETLSSNGTPGISFFESENVALPSNGFK